MAMIQNIILHAKGSRRFAVIFLGAVTLVLSPADLAAQGQPVQNGPMFPVALWWVGAFVLGLVMAYAILRTRRRTPADKELTEQSTKELYAKEEHDRVQSGSV